MLCNSENAIWTWERWGDSVLFTYIVKSSLSCVVIDFAGRKGGARRLRNGQLRLEEWERDPIPDIARGLMCV